MFARKAIPIASLAIGVVALAAVFLVDGPIDAARPDAADPGGSTIQSAPAASPVQRFDKVEKVAFSWGWIRWLMNAEVDPQAEMTFGIVHVEANQRNPMHLHPNSAEYLHVLSGSCKHLLGKEWLTLKAGDTIRIPANVPHMARTLDEPMRAVIVYNTGRRQMVAVEEGKGK